MGSLNREQRAAADCGDGPVLVLAGPGTGKTTTLTARFGALVARGVPPERILAVTFTRKSGDDLIARLVQTHGLERNRLEVGTFHRFGGQILRAHAEQVGLSRRFRILDEGGQRRLLSDLKVHWSTERGRDLLEIIAEAKARMLDAAALRAQVESRLRAGTLDLDDPLVDAVDPYHDYERALLERDCCDFEDLISHTVRLLERLPAVRTEVAQRFEHLLVDEFQDVNQGQFRLLRALLLRHRNLWCVGDDDQSIYGFRGADASYIIDFERNFPEATKYQLTDNYRSTRQILELAQALVGFNPVRYPKGLQAMRGDGPPVVVQAHPEALAEAQWVAAAIAKVLEKGIPPEQVAVLFRTGVQATALQIELQAQSLPFSLQGAADFWRSAPALWLRALLRLSENLSDREALAWLAPRHQATFRKKAMSLGLVPFPRRIERARAFLLQKAPAPEGSRLLEDWSQRLALCAELVGLFPSCEALEAAVTRQDGSSRKAGIALSTIHAAKGLEWHTVFVIGFEQGLLPHNLADDEDEERRLAYVAMTRAKRYLCLSYCAWRHKKQTEASPFLKEALSRADPAVSVIR